MSDTQKKQTQITALRLLAASPKSKKELKDKLLSKGYPEEVVEEVLEALEKQGVLSDAQYAQNLASRYVYGKPSGRKRIEFELKRHGVGSKIREDVLTSLSVEDEKGRARDLGLSQWDKLKKIEPIKRKKRVYDFLLRRGFEYSIVQEIVSALEKMNGDDLNEC